MQIEPEQDAPRWYCLQTNDTILVAALYAATAALALDVEWSDGTEQWCLEVFCSPSQWRALTNPIAKRKAEEIE